MSAFGGKADMGKGPWCPAFAVPRSIPPKGFEPIRCKRGVSRGVLDIAMAKVGLSWANSAILSDWRDQAQV
jgi:hypothetical protein